MKFIVQLVLITCCVHWLAAQTPTADSSQWWKRNNLRVIQVNLPAYEATTLNPDSLVHDLVVHSANTLIINAGGIMAFYPSKLPFHYRNPYLRDSMLENVIAKCHAQKIRVIVRFDFSRAHESIFRAHPDWFYISPANERMINSDMYVVSINGPYVQEKAFAIVGEVIDRFAVDGIFLNMPGYQVRNPYENKYQGIDQNPYDKKAFFDYSGLELPVEERATDTVYQRYLQFKEYTIEAWAKRLQALIRSKRPGIALCTYFDKYVDIIRHESQTNSLPYWPYSASDNVANATNSYPDHVISNSSIQQISFQSRYNAVEPQEVSIRLYENIANGSGLDVSMMGDMRDYEDERNFEVIRNIYAFHRRYQPYFGKYSSPAKICVIAPGNWPTGESMQEYRGVLLMLKEAHFPADIIEDRQIASRADRLGQYRLVILPDILNLTEDAIRVLRSISAKGTSLLATNRTLIDKPEALFGLFGAKINTAEADGTGKYLSLQQPGWFKRLPGQSMIFWKFNLAEYDLSGADSMFLPQLSKGRPGPPEIIGGHAPTGYFTVGLKSGQRSSSAIFAGNIGKLYYLHGYQEHKNLLLDIVDRLYPQAAELLQTNAPPRVETILQEFWMNTPGSDTSRPSAGFILHLVNLTGFSGNTYFDPIPISNLAFNIALPFRPKKVYRLTDKRAIPFQWQNGSIKLSGIRLGEFNSIVMER